MVLSAQSVADTCPGAGEKESLFICINCRIQKNEEEGK